MKTTIKLYVKDDDIPKEDNLYLLPIGFNKLSNTIPAKSIIKQLYYHNKYGLCVLYSTDNPSKDAVPYKRYAL